MPNARVVSRESVRRANRACSAPLMPVMKRGQDQKNCYSSSGRAVGRIVSAKTICEFDLRQLTYSQKCTWPAHHSAPCIRVDSVDSPSASIDAIQKREMKTKPAKRTARETKLSSGRIDHCGAHVRLAEAFRRNYKSYASNALIACARRRCDSSQ